MHRLTLLFVFILCFYSSFGSFKFKKFKRGCGVKRISHGHCSTSKSFFFFTKVKCVCDRGFVLKSKGRLFCRFGRFKGRFPLCVPIQNPIRCRRPKEPNNGSIRPPTGDLFKPGQKIWFACDRGLILVGHKDFKCQKDGNWSPRGFPLCNPPPPPPVCTNGRWTQYFDRDNPSGNFDYESLTDINKEFRGKACSNPTEIDAEVVSSGVDYRLTGQVLKVGPTIGLICENRRQANRKCLDYKVRFCCPRPIQCRRPNEPDNGSIRPPKGDLFNPGQKVWFACDRGFDLVGHKDFRCQDDGNWSPRDFPGCYRVAISCEHSKPGSASCPPGHVIKVVRGFYGRDDTTTCRGGNVENTNCFADGSEEKLRRLCQDKTSCHLEASSCAFGDPCYGIRKYLKLIYYCKKH